MIPNERPTPLTDAFWKAMIESNPPMLGAPEYDFARTLERSLAERTEERDKWANVAAQYSAEREHNANMALAYKAERDTALAKLAKCREALEEIGNSDVCADEAHACEHQSIARQTPEETK